MYFEILFFKIFLDMQFLHCLMIYPVHILLQIHPEDSRKYAPMAIITPPIMNDLIAFGLIRMSDFYTV